MLPAGGPIRLGERESEERESHSFRPSTHPSAATMSHAAPELMLSPEGCHTTASDIFALGVLL